MKLVQDPGGSMRDWIAIKLRRRPPPGELRDLASIHFRLRTFRHAPTPDPDEGWQRFRPLLVDRPAPSVVRRRRLRSGTAAVAAAAVLTAGIAFAAEPMYQAASEAWRGLVRLIDRDEGRDVANEQMRRNPRGGAAVLPRDAEEQPVIDGDEPRPTRNEGLNNGPEDHEATPPVTTTPPPPNLAPVAQPDQETTPEDTSVVINVLANDEDPDQDLLEITATGPVPDAVKFDPSGTVTYVPPQDFNGVAEFKYEVSDGRGAAEWASVLVTVKAVNDDPVAVDDQFDTPEGAPGLLDVLANDRDPDEGDDLKVAIATQPTNGRVEVGEDGGVTYTPMSGYVGPDSFTYTVSDGTAPPVGAKVDINVTPRPIPPAPEDTAEPTP
jgi:hypothetical protein